MSKMNKFSGKEKQAILKEVVTGHGSLTGIAFKYDISVGTLKEWRRRYELYGIEGLGFRAGNKNYSVELKIQAVETVPILAVHATS